jgi:hypothetical protein
MLILVLLLHCFIYSAERTAYFQTENHDFVFLELRLYVSIDLFRIIQYMQSLIQSDPFKTQP